MSELISFSDYLKNERRYSLHTLTAYVKDVEQFFCFVQNQYEISAEAEVKPSMIKAWVYHQTQNKLSPRSINRKLVALNTFYKCLLRNNKVNVNPLAAIQSVKTGKQLYQWLPKEDLNHLLDSADMGFEAGFAGFRDKLIIELLYGTGMRLSELISLKEKNVSVSEGIIKVLGKRNKERIIPLPAECISAIHIYIGEKMLSGFVSEELLVTNAGKPLYPMFVNRCVKKYIGLVSTIEKKSPHVLRHSYATGLLNNGADINAIKELLGHSSLAATQVYTHNSIERLKTIYKQAHPKG